MMLISASTTTLVFPWKKNLGHPEAENWHLCLLQKGQNFLKAALRAGEWNLQSSPPAAEQCSAAGGERLR